MVFLLLLILYKWRSIISHIKTAPFIFVIKMLFGASLVYYIFMLGGISTSSAINVLSNIKVWLVVFAINISAMLLATLRLNIMLRIPYLELLQIVWMSLALGLFLPGPIGTDIAKIYYLRKNDNTHKTRHTIPPIFGDRLISICGLLLLSLFFGNIHEITAIMKYATIIQTVTILVTAISIIVFASFFSIRITLKTLSLSIFTHALKISAVLVILSFFNHNIDSTGNIISLSAICLLIESLPISIAGIGTTHLAFYNAFLMLKNSNGANVYNVYILIGICTRLLGLIIWVFRSKISKKNSTIL